MTLTFSSSGESPCWVPDPNPWPSGSWAIVARGLGLPLPGPGPRHAFLFLALTLRGGASANLQTPARPASASLAPSSCRRGQASSSICTGWPTGGCRFCRPDAQHGCRPGGHRRRDHACRPTPGGTDAPPHPATFGSGGLAPARPGTVTLLAYQGWLVAPHRRSGMDPSPAGVLLAVRPSSSLLLLLATGTPYATLASEAPSSSIFPGPATVAWPVPLYAQIRYAPCSAHRRRICWPAA